MNLDWLLGPRIWQVVRYQPGGFVPVLMGATWPWDMIIRDGLRYGAATRLARRLREQARDKPEGVL